MRRADRPPLTEKQSRVLELAAMGMTDKQIASRLGIGSSTMLGYMRRIHAALDIAPGVNMRCRAIFVAHRLGLINIDDMRDEMSAPDLVAI